MKRSLGKLLLFGLVVGGPPVVAVAEQTGFEAGVPVDLTATTTDQHNVEHTPDGLRLTAAPERAGAPRAFRSRARSPRWAQAAHPGYRSRQVRGTRRHQGFYVSPPIDTGDSTRRLSATLRTERPARGRVLLEVRGRTPAGRWTEWRTATETAPPTPPRTAHLGPSLPPKPSPAEQVSEVLLPDPAQVVQVRIALSAPDGDPYGGPRISGLRLTPRPDPPTAPAQKTPSQKITSRVFATRIGEVGERTANGHTIGKRDVFVALPSRRALNPSVRATDYLVRICYPRNGRCTVAPVWDVGPWNIRDDYWNPPDEREMWSDLPHGRPQAQAAYQDSYNGGRDDRARKVLNPAGIDLADGLFWDVLKMTGNDWVEVTYLWAKAEEPPISRFRRIFNAPAQSLPSGELNGGLASFDPAPSAVTIEKILAAPRYRPALVSTAFRKRRRPTKPFSPPAPRELKRRV
ncbi:hypothetical protein [Nonomuraea longicatena]|uniref:Secreted protein n=1 Tax=Nonomuraea longicatena TaxID=83682 RepID=A0ABN1P978_9ACTN